MSVGTRPGLMAFSAWVRETDDHAAHHLEVLERVQSLLDQPADESNNERREMAAKLERWRYQFLNEHAQGVSERGEQFVSALERTARILRGSGPLEPRQTRHAVVDPTVDLPTFGAALRAFQPSCAFDDLILQATRLTALSFGDLVPLQRTGHVGRPMLLYAPLYVSSDCVNWCTYCGFRYPRQIPRRHLSVAECVGQARILQDHGFRHILIVGGDFPSRTTVDYYVEIIRELRRLNLELSLEIASQTIGGYAQLVEAGACGLTLYQETYDEMQYSTYHVRGPKASFAWRLEAHDRAAEAGMSRLGLGILLGLADPQEDLLAMMRHAAYLLARFPDRTLAFSLPRIHQAPDDFEIPFRVSDEQLIRMYCALRIAFPQAVLVLSTRESSELRNRLANICITQMSAGSSTTPGGYDNGQQESGQQFPVVDQRSPETVVQWLRAGGFSVCWSTAEETRMGPR